MSDTQLVGRSVTNWDKELEEKPHRSRCLDSSSSIYMRDVLVVAFWFQDHTYLTGWGFLLPLLCLQTPRTRDLQLLVYGGGALVRSDWSHLPGVVGKIHSRMGPEQVEDVQRVEDEGTQASHWITESFSARVPCASGDIPIVKRHFGLSDGHCWVEMVGGIPHTL